MPILNASDYVPSRVFRHRHLATYIPYFFRKAPTLPYNRIRINTEDDDFLDLDCVLNGSDRLAILCHGLEGDSNSKYIRSIGSHLIKENFDLVAMNYRGCSGEMNRRLQMYHSGKTEDLNEVIQYFIAEYKSIILVGFSLGGNIVLKYLGERGGSVHYKIKGGITISVPCDLGGCARAFSKRENYLYEKNFMDSLVKKVKQKKLQYPNEIDLEKLNQVHNIYSFDDNFTAPIHGFIDAEDYYKQCSSKQFLAFIDRPTLLISSIDDPFLVPEAIPYYEATNSDYLYLSPTQYGGHVGFAWDLSKPTYIEEKAIDFIRNNIQW